MYLIFFVGTKQIEKYHSFDVAQIVVCIRFQCVIFSQRVINYKVQTIVEIGANNQSKIQEVFVKNHSFFLPITQDTF